MLWSTQPRLQSAHAKRVVFPLQYSVHFSPSSPPGKTKSLFILWLSWKTLVWIFKTTSLVIQWWLWSRLVYIVIYLHSNLAIAAVYSQCISFHPFQWTAQYLLCLEVLKGLNGPVLTWTTDVMTAPHQRGFYPENSVHSVIRGEFWNSIPRCCKIRILLFGADR